MTSTSFQNMIGAALAVVCASLMGSADAYAQCAHSECVEGAGLAAGCSACAAVVCGVDDYCCNTAWDDQCVAEAEALCSAPSGCGPGLVCSANQCVAPAACSHPENVTGAALVAGCSPCAAVVCADDPFCCNPSNNWDNQCVQSAASLCSSCVPTTCAAAGASCGTINDGCGGTLNCGGCDNGAFCDGVETCSNNSCVAGTPPCNGQSCNEATDSCNSGCASNADCSDGAFCNGVEICNNGTCQAGSDPCGGQSCDEGNDSCAQCSSNSDCNNGAFCDGIEVCSNGTCVAGTNPCPGAACDETTNACFADVPPSFTSGPAVPNDLGPAPSSNYMGIVSLEFRNDQNVTRSGEMAFSGVPIAKALNITDLSKLVLVGPGERRLQAQFTALSRWGSSPNDTNAPVRWLEVATNAYVDPNGSSFYSLRNYPSAGSSNDPIGVTLSSSGNMHTINTGAATFVLNAQIPELIQQITVGGRQVYAGGGGPRAVDQSGNSMTPTVDPNGFAIEELGPVKAIIRTRGHFQRIITACGADLGYTMRMTFVRGSSHVNLEFEIRNECGDGFQGPWTATHPVSEISWSFPLNLTTPLRRNALVTDEAQDISNAGNTSAARIEQQYGSTGNPNWRRAVCVRGASTLEVTDAFNAPMVAVGDNQTTASAALAWMRFREPQAIRVNGSTIEIQFLSDNVAIGEAQARWNFAQLRFFGGNMNASQLSNERDASIAELERGLLPRGTAAYVNSTGALKRLPVATSGPQLNAYLSALNMVHNNTLLDWEDKKNYGTSWPDNLFDRFEPSQNAAGNFTLGNNYWSPTWSELTEYFRSGDPKWVWDFALPQEHTFLKQIVYNTGTRDSGGVRSGFHAGGIGNTPQTVGRVFRDGGSSDDWLYNQGSDEAYVIRPTGSIRDVFAKACQTFIARYDAPPTGGDRFVSQLVIERQVMQHVNMLRYAAEFVRDPALNAACQAKLQFVMQKYVDHNLFGGIFCPDLSGNTNSCDSDAAFMYSALHEDVFAGYYFNWGDDHFGGAIRNALATTAQQTFLHIPVRSGGNINTGVGWNNELRCTFSGGNLNNCTGIMDGEPSYVVEFAMHISTVLAGNALSPVSGTCSTSSDVLTTMLQDQTWIGQYTTSGWWKGGSQTMHNIVHGIGYAEQCSAGCSSNSDCNDGLFCNGVETCNAGTCVAGTPPNVNDGVSCTDDFCDESNDVIVNSPNNSNCDNGLFCDGAETCSATNGCQAGTPVNCNDGIACTNDSCNEATDSCNNAPNNGACDNGLFCDGAETCVPGVGCQAGTVPCGGMQCNENNDTCPQCVSNSDCDDGQFCNGAEICSGGSCVGGTPPNVDDGVACTDDSCDEANDRVVNTANNGNCDNGLFCDGAEICNPSFGCEVGTPPNCGDGVNCTNDSCNEITDNCDSIPDDGNCNDGLFCNGAEFCDAVNDCQPGSEPCQEGACNEDSNMCDGGAAIAAFETGNIVVGANAVTVNLRQVYVSPVVITTANYVNNSIPVVTRVSNVTTTSFDVRLQNPSGGFALAEAVKFLVVEEGAWTINGVNIEAQRYLSTRTDENNSWVGEAQNYLNNYNNPVVLGQVMSENDPEWSVFWSRGGSVTSPPDANTLFTGKTVGEDPNTNRADEIVGFVVIEAGHGTIGGFEYEARLGVDSVQGAGDNPPYEYTFDTPFPTIPSVAIVSLAGMDGNNGGWAQMHGADPVSATTLGLSIDEDQEGDGERNHTTEQVSYLVFGTAGAYPSGAVCQSNADCDDGQFCNGDETCNAGTCLPGTPPEDDGIACTIDSCNEANDTVSNVPNHSVCDNGLFCDGSEICNPASGCEPSNPPCTGGATCDEGGDQCIAPVVYYLSFNSAADLPDGGPRVADEDVVSYNPATGVWELVFDGSDVGVTTDIDALDVLPDGSFVMSFDVPTDVPGVGTVDDSDLVRFVPTSAGQNTAGAFSWYFDGSDVLLTTNGEDIDGVHVTSAGDLMLSTRGGFNVGTLNGADEDVFLFVPSSLGENTAGSITDYVFDGSDEDFNNAGGDDLDGISFDGADLLFTTVGTYNGGGGTAPDEDISRFVGTLGNDTAGNATPILDLTALGIAGNEDVDALAYR